MSTKRSPKSAIAKFALVLGFAVVGAQFGFYAGAKLKATGLHLTFSLWHVVLVPLCFLLVIAWHELGHLTGGWLSGFQLSMFVVGPLKIERAHDELRVRLNRSLGLAGGLAASVPRPGMSVDQATMQKALLHIVAGGPLFSLAGAFLLFPAWLMQGASPHLALLLGAIGALSLVIAIATLIPLSTGGFRSDGARILQLLRGGEAAGRWAGLALLAGLTYTVRPRDWPQDLVFAAAKLDERSFDAVSGAWLRACHHADRGELDDAKIWIAEALAGADEWPKAAHSALHATAACIHAIARDPVIARMHFSQIRSAGLIPKEHVLHAEALVLFAEGNRPAALQTAHQALKLIPVHAQGSATSQREDLERILAQMHLSPRLK